MVTTRRAPIAFFYPSMRGGGAERILVNLVEGLVAKGIPVDVVLAAAVGPLLGDLPPAARVVDLGWRRVLPCLVPLAKYLRREQPRVLVSSMSHANVVALWARALSRKPIPVIVTVHNTLSVTSRRAAYTLGWIWPPLIRAFYPQAEGIVAVSKAAADDLARTARIPRRRIEVIYNPVITTSLRQQAGQAPEHPWFAPGQPPVVLGVGRLTEQKDFPTLIRAFAEVRKRRPARLVILGEGPDRAALTSLIAELGLQSDVALPGFLDNAAAYMAHSAVFALSSAWEGLPTVLIEAMAAGARVVSTDCPSGPREILQDGRLGALVPVGDSAALAAAIVAALDQPNGKVPPEALVPFTREAALEHYLRLIESTS
jgi:glycosyltransferase involved in cell wall biosynthesis